MSHGGQSCRSKAQHQCGNDCNDANMGLTKDELCRTWHGEETKTGSIANVCGQKCELISELTFHAADELVRMKAAKSMSSSIVKHAVENAMNSSAKSLDNKAAAQDECHDQITRAEAI